MNRPHPRRRRRRHNVPLCLLASAWLVLTCLASISLAEVRVSDAYLREAPPGQRVNAGFMTITNDGAQRVTLLGATSPRASSIELHTHIEHDGQLRMRRLPHVHIGAHASKRFATGGLHLMVFNLAPRARAGEDIDIELTFDDGTRLTVPFRVRSVFEELQ